MDEAVTKYQRNGDLIAWLAIKIIKKINVIWKHFGHLDIAQPAYLKKIISVENFEDHQQNKGFTLPICVGLQVDTKLSK